MKSVNVTKLFSLPLILASIRLVTYLGVILEHLYMGYIHNQPTTHSNLFSAVLVTKKNCFKAIMKCCKTFFRKRKVLG
jgi:hypothetical protein